MEAGGLPLLNCLLQHTLKSLCSKSDSSKWVYAVFWRILPRNYPPPKWDPGRSIFSFAKGNKRNWILVWEDGFCDFYECERSRRRFGADIFFKMSHEVYNVGEGLVGKVAADNSHKWIFRDKPKEKDTSFISSWTASVEPQPRAWAVQFNSGIQTIAIISVREGIIQLGSFDMVTEDLNLVISIQRKFSYLQSIPGIYAIQRPYLPSQHPYTYKPDNPRPSYGIEDNNQLIRSKRLQREQPDESPAKAINLGYNRPQSMAGLPFWYVPPLFPSTPSCLGALLSKVPIAESYYFANVSNNNALHDQNMRTNTNQNVNFDEFGHVQVTDVKVEAAEEDY